MERVYCFGVLKRLLMTVAVCMLAATAVAYDFSSTHKGKELYYDITSATTVKVTYPSYGSDYASGDVVIPTEVANNGTTYRVTTVGNNAFRACSSLAEITIGSSVATIGDYAFYDCRNLTSAVSLAATPPLVKYEAFPQSDKCSLRVPCGSLKAYTAEGSYWNKAFSQRIVENCKKQLR